jgi:predicted NBD/HSP70 family sugar kinase
MEHGRILNPPRFSLWHNTDIADMIAKGLSLPAYLENNASSLARYHLDTASAEGSENFLLLLVDSGIGSGVVLNGKLFYGATAFTGELGHTSIRFDGKPCACGNRGCLEAYAAMPNLLADTRFSSWSDVMNERLIAPDAEAVFEEEISYLSAGVVNLVNLLAIDTVLLAGDLRYEGAVSAAALAARVNACVLRHGRAPVKVLPTHMDENIKPLASADIVFERYLRV